MTATVLQCDREAAGCPWCDDPPEISSDAQRTIIACRNHYCLADASAEGETREEALTIWNTRHDSTRDLVEAPSMDRTPDKLRLAKEDAEYLRRIAEDADENNWQDWGAAMRQAADRIDGLVKIALATLQGTER